jgi:hypothetical protein
VHGCSVREGRKIRSKKLLTRPASLEMYRKREGQDASTHSSTRPVVRHYRNQ